MGAVPASIPLVPLTATGPHRAWASARLSHSMPMVHTALLAVQVSTQLVPPTATGPHRALASAKLSHSLPMVHTALSVVQVSTLLVLPSATGPHRAWSSVRLMPLVWEQVASSTRPVPMLLLAFTIMVLAPLPIQLASVRLSRSP